MLNREEYIKRITRLLNDFKSYIISINELKLYDTNKKAEDFFKDLLKYYDEDFVNLKNANEENSNAKSIDLIDEEKKLAIQVTSRTDSLKIHQTIEGFYKNYPDLQRVIILLIGKVKPNYLRTDFTQGGKYKFDKDKNIIDVQDIINKFDSYDAVRLKPILEFLENEIAYVPLLLNSTQEASRNILAEIFNYVFNNFKSDKSKNYQNNKDFTHINKKIPLNFSKKQETIINGLFARYLKYEYLIREFIEAEQGNPFRIDGLLNKIQSEYCEMQGLNNPNEKIKDIFVFKKIAEKLTPSKDAEYILNAQLIVLYFFERCDIGKKTDEEPKSKQRRLFD